MSDNKKQITKICIKCVEANKALGNVNSNFKIHCEYGACDVCGEHYVIVPFGRYFQPNAEVKAYNIGIEDNLGNPSENIDGYYESVDERMGEIHKRIDQLETSLGYSIEPNTESQSIDSRLSKLYDLYDKLKIEQEVEDKKNNVIESDGKKGK